MAKYVLLSFDDDKLADEFVQQFTDDVVERAKYERTGIYAYVRGVYKKPTKFCTCVGIKKRGFTRGKKYGWWVCDQCKKPTVGWGRGDHWFLALGKNLLPVGGNAPEYRGDGVFARHFKECSVCNNTLMTELGHATTHVWCPQCQEWR
jgi:hypothetical protein